MKKQLETRKGFTIIEVVLVLAIAGLIFLMVFIALPALQRSQRDTQRSNDIQRLMATINNYKSNNRGALPSGSGMFVNVDGTIKNGRSGSDVSMNSGTWGYFYKNYLLAGTDIFEDPNGLTYGLNVVDCGAANKTNGATCGNNAQRTNTTFENQDGVILIVKNAMCNGETTVYNAGERNVAAVYKREGGGTICMAN